MNTEQRYFKRAPSLCVPTYNNNTISTSAHTFITENISPYTTPFNTITTTTTTTAIRYFYTRRRRCNRLSTTQSLIFPIARTTTTSSKKKKKIHTPPFFMLGKICGFRKQIYFVVCGQFYIYCKCETLACRF